MSRHSTSCFCDLLDTIHLRKLWLINKQTHRFITSSPSILSLSQFFNLSSNCFQRKLSTKIIVSLKSSDGHTFRIEEATARQCQTKAHAIDDDCANNEILLPNVTSKILAMVMEYCKKHHVDDAKPSSGEDLKKWDEQFMQTDQSTIFDLILAANYLNIKSLLGLTCQTVADMIKDETPNQIRSNFNIEKDYTPEEEEAVRKKNY